MAESHERKEPEHAADMEVRRIIFAASRVADHAARELALLEHARRVQDADRARELEFHAGAAHRDSVALTEEHGLGR